MLDGPFEQEFVYIGLQGLSLLGTLWQLCSHKGIQRVVYEFYGVAIIYSVQDPMVRNLSHPDPPIGG